MLFGQLRPSYDQSDPPPPISDFPPILKGFLHRDSPIFEKLPPSLKLDIIYGRPLKCIFYLSEQTNKKKTSKEMKGK